MTNLKIHPKTVLLTGATSGIGSELAEIFAKEGANLILVARTAKDLEQQAQSLRARHKVNVKIHAVDLSKRESTAKLLDDLKQAGTQVTVLVNNAGFGLYGEFKETDWAKESQMLDLNIYALTQLTKAFLPDMIARGDGKILNIASTAAFQPGPLMAVYYASKAYVLSFSEAIANEVEGTGVTVTALCPGPTKSRFQDTASMRQSKLVKGPIADPKSVAQAGYEALMKGEHVKVPGIQNAILAFVVRFLPRGLAVKLSRAAVAPIAAG